MRIIAFGLVLLLQGAVPMAASDPSAECIPEGFDFPRSGCELRRVVEKHDQHGLRRHAWNVFAGMTQKAQAGWGNPSPGPPKPIWMTWHLRSSIFSGGGGTAPFERPLELQFSSLARSAKSGCDPAIMLEIVYFNEEAFRHITTPQPWNPNEQLQDCRLSVPTPENNPPPNVLMNDPNSLNAYLKGLHLIFAHNLARAGVPAFPPRAVDVKSVWWVVSAKKPYTTLPVWDGASKTPSPGCLSMCGWRTAVAIDSDLSHRKPKPYPGPETRRTASLRDFFFYSLDKAHADKWNSYRSGCMPKADEGDYLILIGMHFTTKEMVDWVWTTLWWHDHPNRGEFAKDRPKTVTGPWANYLMDVSYDMLLPHARDGGPHACFNPYLEAQMPDGLNSNCMTCHRLAVWAKGNITSDPVVRGFIPQDHPLFQQKAKLDYVWSVAKAQMAARLLLRFVLF